MVEENSEFWWSEMLQNEVFQQPVNFLIVEHLHHGWRKILMLMIWNMLPNEGKIAYKENLVSHKLVLRTKIFWDL